MMVVNNLKSRMTKDSTHVDNVCGLRKVYSTKMMTPFTSICNQSHEHFICVQLIICVRVYMVYLRKIQNRQIFIFYLHYQ